MPGSGGCSDISFSLRRGEILGIAGLMGAGRTELLECLFGASTRAAAGRDLSRRPAGRLSPSGRSHAGRHRPGDRRPQAAGDLRQSDVGDNITHLHAGRKLTRPAGSAAGTNGCQAAATVEQLGVKTAGIAAPDHQPQRRQPAEGDHRPLAARPGPSVLLLDDPTRGIDVGAKAELYRLMDRLCRDGLGHHRHLQRAARAAHAVRPHPGPLRRAQDRASFSAAEATEQRIMELATRPQQSILLEAGRRAL